MAALKRPLLGTLAFVAVWVVLFGGFQNILEWETSAKVLNAFPPDPRWPRAA